MTSAGMNGRVQDDEGEILIGATVIALHVPTGTEYGAVTNVDGYFYFPNIRVGGPYKVTASYVGFQEVSFDGIRLGLGEKRNLDFSLPTEANQLAEVIVTASTNDLINSGRTGASTNVSTETINTNPSISRSINDFVRLTPQAATGVGNGGISIAGSNGRFNNVTVDGAVNNDAFGLNAGGLPGSSAGSEPISLDAIEEISVLVAPYDVTKGSFTGGGINAVTRSGTNEFEGSAYFFNRNQNLAGRTIEEPRMDQPEFFNRQYGFRLGGPIVKDKVFFFANMEQQRAEEPFQVNLVNQATLDAFGDDVPDNVSLVSTETAQAVKDNLMQRFGYDAGDFGPFTPTSENLKIFGKIDYNINENHQVSFRHSYLKATDDNVSRSQSTLQFTNNGYLNDVVSNSSVLEWRGRFGDNMSNNLIVGYTSINRERNLDDFGPLFPHVDIRDGATTIRVGSQRSSVGNELEQGIGQFTNNFTIFKNRHVITIGTHNEWFNIFNSFVNRYPGHYEYRSLDDFFNDTLGSGRFRVAHSLDYFNDRFQAVELNFLQSGWYIQDEWSVNSQLKLTAGIRMDLPIFQDEPSRNDALIASEFARDNTNLPSAPLWSPRVGFNYDLKGDQSIQLRGGAGIFTGRVPFVWLSNAYTNAGATLGLADERPSRGGADVPLFGDGNRTYEAYIANELGVGIDDPAVQAEIIARQQGSPRSQIDLIDEDFKLPQTFRANLAVDAKLPYGLIGTFEAIYSKNVNAVRYRNLQLDETATETITEEAGRPRFVGDDVSGDFRDIFELTNTNKGYQYSFTGQLTKAWSNNLFATGSYTYGVSKDVNGGTHTTANSGWEFNPTPGNPNAADVSWAVWDLRHRIMANVNYVFDYSDFASTSIGLFYSGQSGAPFTFGVNGDVNGDGSFGNDQFYIPRDQNDINLVDDGDVTAAEQWAALDRLISNDDYLSENRGKISERNAGRTPWTNIVDIRFTQEFKLELANGKTNRLQFTFDIENIGNMLNKDWGNINTVRFDDFDIVSYEGLNEAGETTYTFDTRVDEPWTLSNASIWRAQFGVRYIFD